MNNKIFTAILIGAGNRGEAYTNVMLECKDKFKVIGVAEPLEDRRNNIKIKHNIPEENCYTDWVDILNAPKLADVAIISTMDRMHLAPALKAIELGYDILLEKPACPTPEDCSMLYKAAKAKGTKIMVCHVLRYTPFFLTIKHLIDSGKLGKIMSVQHLEAVGNVHQSHSFVRGNWGNSEETSPMLLQKSCHDLDILQWLLGKECKRIHSFGNLTYFTRENAPEGSPEYCIEGCPEKDCPYNAVKLYYDDKKNDWFRSTCTKIPNATDEQVEHAIRTTQYGKCVYKCNNNVVDHQIVNMEFEDDITVSFTMTAFNAGGRYIRIFGTKGELVANMEEKDADFFDFKTREYEKISTNDTAVITSLVGGHGGGDTGIVHSLYEYLTGKLEAKDVSEIGISARNHMLVFAAEESRKNGTVVDAQEYIKKHLG